MLFKLRAEGQEVSHVKSRPGAFLAEGYDDVCHQVSIWHLEKVF